MCLNVNVFVLIKIYLFIYTTSSIKQTNPNRIQESEKEDGVEKGNHFCHLRRMLVENGNYDVKIKRRIAMAKTTLS